MIDTHVNLHHSLYGDDLKDVLLRAQTDGVNGMLTICDRMENLAQIQNICRANKNIWYSVGAHPHEAKDHLDLKVGDLLEHSQDELMVGIGETGLDFHYDLSPRDQQISVFQKHIEASQNSSIPLIVHTRLADEIMGDILENAMKFKEFPLLMHCYTSSNALLKRMLQLDAYVSISGIATFKNANDVRANIMDIPLDRLLIETDCPYLAPIPKRGQRNEPMFVKYILEFLAQYKNMDDKELCEILDSNFFALFKKAKLVESV